MSRKKMYTREQYYDQFCRLMNRLNYIPEEGEVIVQANKNYPQYRFISNKGRVFTVSRNCKNILKPYCGRVGRNRKRKQWTLHRTQKKIVPIHRLVLEHFCPDEIERIVSQGKAWDGHHVIPVTRFSKDHPQFANRLSNLQVVEAERHKRANRYQRGDAYFKELFKKAENQIPQKSYRINRSIEDICRYMIQSMDPKDTEAEIVVPNKDGTVIWFTDAGRIKFRD